MKKIIGIVGMVILLAVSAFLDQLFHRFENLKAPSLQPVIPFWAEIPVYIALSILLLGLAWYVLYANSRSLLVAIVYIVVGMVILVSMTIFGYFAIWSLFLYLIPDISPLVNDIIASSMALTRHCAAMILIIGLVRLIPDKSLWRRNALNVKIG